MQLNFPSVDVLEDHGLTVWVDRTGLGTGDNFLSKIGQAIINAEVRISCRGEEELRNCG